MYKFLLVFVKEKSCKNLYLIFVVLVCVVFICDVCMCFGIVGLLGNDDEM